MKTKSKNLDIVYTMLFWIFIWFCIFICLNKSKHYNEEEQKISSMKVGQVWKHTYDENNPYKETIIYYHKIISINGDYILYIENNKDTLSSKKNLFILNSDLVK
jgi:hypothetical protein